MDLFIDYNQKKNAYFLNGNDLPLLREVLSSKKGYIPKPKNQKFSYSINTRDYFLPSSAEITLPFVWELSSICQKVDPNFVLDIPNEIEDTLLSNVYNLEESNLSNFDGFEYRPYQHKALLNMLKTGMGLVLVGTGGGKTLIMAAITETILRCRLPKNKKILIILPDLGLLEKTYHDFCDEYGIDSNLVTCWSGDNELDRKKPIVICNQGIINSRFKKEQKWITEDVDLVLVDEVHSVKHGNAITKKLNKIKTLHKFGFTGSLPEKDIDIWAINSIFGPVLFEHGSVQLRKEKQLSQARVVKIGIEYKKLPDYQPEETDIFNFNIVLDFIINNKYRNSVIKKICENCDGNVLIMVDRIDHGNIIKESLEKSSNNKKVVFVNGAMSVSERREIISDMEDCNNYICIAMSKIFSTGINIKNLPYILFASGGKSEVKIIQSIGRGLRLHKNKTELVIFDIVDDLLFLQKQFNKRLDIYNSEFIPVECKDITEKL